VAFPPSAVAADKTNATNIDDDHPAHHNALAGAVNDITSEIQTWTVNRDADGKRLDAIGKINIGGATDEPLVRHMDVQGAETFSAAEHVLMFEFENYTATFDTTDGGSFVGWHMTPLVTGSASVTEIVGVQSQVSSTTNVTSQIHAVEALVNFGKSGGTAALSRSVWAQTAPALGTITEAHGVDVTGSSGAGTVGTFYGLRVGRTAGALSIPGTTKYGVYVNQGSVRNYFGGDTQFGGGANGAWDSKVVAITSAGLAVTGATTISGQTLVGVTSHAGGLNPELSLETAFTESATSSHVGLAIVGTKTFNTNTGSSYYGAYVFPTVTSSVAMSEVAGQRTDITKTGGGTTTSGYGQYIRYSSGASTTTTTAVGLYAATLSALGTITTGVGVDIASANSFGTYTTTIGLRITDLAGGTTKWGMQVGDYQSYHHGRVTLGATTAPTYALDIKGTAQDRGVIALTETATPTNPASSAQVLIYAKSDAIVFGFNDAGTMRYKSLTLSGTGTTWAHSTTAP
jgi:hypothetical protein